MKPLEYQDHKFKFGLKLSSDLSFLKHNGAWILAGCNSPLALVQLKSAPSEYDISWEMGLNLGIKYNMVKREEFLKDVFHRNCYIFN